MVDSCFLAMVRNLSPELCLYDVTVLTNGIACDVMASIALCWQYIACKRVLRNCIS